MKAHQKLLYIGQLLKDKRQQKGLSLKYVSQKTCVGTTILKAIEEGQMEQLPAYTYLRGFILAYAQVIDLDTKDIIKEIKQLHPSPDQLVEMSNHPSSAQENIVETELHLMPVVVAVCILFVLGGILVFFNTFKSEEETYLLDSEKAIKTDTVKKQKSSVKKSHALDSKNLLKDKSSLVEKPMQSGAGTLSSSDLPVEVVVKALKQMKISYQIDKGEVKTVLIKKDHFEVFKARLRILIRANPSDQIQIFHNGKNLGFLGSGGLKESIFSE